jgi:hypothetical protein
MAIPRSAVLLAAPWLLIAEEGFSPVLGGLPFDSGFAMGLQYRTPAGLPRVPEFRARAVGSVKKYELLEAALAAPPMARGLLFAETRARYRNYPEEDFWGLGAKSHPDRRTTFRLEDFDWTTAFGLRPRRPLEVGIAAGWRRVNVGPGRDRDFPSIEQRFAPREVPGLERQPRFVHAGAFLRLDLRDESDDARRGGYYEFRGTWFRDRSSGPYRFRRWEADLRQYLPAARPQDTIGLRLQAVLTDKAPPRQIPFFFQPTLGGGNDLRGYRQYRFRDENALAGSFEYRLRVREIFHLVGFADGGGVFERPGRISLRGMRGSLGAGVRLKLTEGLAFGLELGWSPEGLRLWFRTAPAF